MKIKYLEVTPLKIFGVFFLFIIFGSILSIKLGVLDVGPKGLFYRLTLAGDVIIEIGDQEDGRLVEFNKVSGARDSLIPSNINAFNPALSPNGKQLVFVYRKSNETQYHIGLLNLGSKGITDLMDGGVGLFNISVRTSIAWSPAGDQIILNLVSGDGSCFQLVRLDPQGLSYEFLDVNFCKEDLDYQTERVDISWFPGESPLLGIVTEYGYGPDNIYMLSESMDELIWIAHGESPAWRPGTLDITYICSSSLCAHSLSRKTEASIVERYVETQYVWSSDGEAILLLDQGGESDPTWLSVIDISSGEWIHLYKFSNFGNPWYQDIVWISK